MVVSNSTERVTSKEVLKLLFLVILFILAIADFCGSMILLGTYGQGWIGPTSLLVGFVLLFVIGSLAVWVCGNDLD